MKLWTVNEDGFASGPSVLVEGAGRSVEVSAVWTDEDGVCVSVDSFEEPIPASLAAAVVSAIQELSALDAPERSTI